MSYPSSVGRAPVNELLDKSKNAAKTKELDKQATNERHQNTAKLLVLLEAEPQARVTQLKHSLNSDKLPSSVGRAPVNEFLDKSKDAAKTKEMERQAKNERHQNTAKLFVLKQSRKDKSRNCCTHSIQPSSQPRQAG